VNRDTSEVLAKKAWDLFNAKQWQEAGDLFQQLMQWVQTARKWSYARTRSLMNEPTIESLTFRGRPESRRMRG
jgi:hypothetical protein